MIRHGRSGPIFRSARAKSRRVPFGSCCTAASSDQQGTGREQVRSRRRGRRRLIDLALTAAEPFPDGLDRRTSCAWIRGLARSVVGVNRKESA